MSLIPNTGGTAKVILSKRLTLMHYLAEREVAYDLRANAFAFVPRVTWAEVDALFGGDSDRVAPPFGFVADVEHFFPSNGKMIAPTWSLPAGPTRYGGTCAVASAWFELKSIDFVADGEQRTQQLWPGDPRRQAKLQASKEAQVQVGPAPADAQKLWVCNDCYALKGNFIFLSKIMKWVALAKWLNARMTAGDFAPAMITMIRHNQDRLLRVLERGARRKAMSPEQAAAAGVAHPAYFRVHDAGDFFSVPYFEAWCEIAEACPDIQFWAATRVWALPRFAKALSRVHCPPNFIIRPSELFKGQPPSPHEWPAAAASMVALSPKKDPRFRKPAGSIVCPVASTDMGTCQNTGHLVRYRRPRRTLPWPAGCRACWDAPQTPIVYMEH